MNRKSLYKFIGCLMLLQFLAPFSFGQKKDNYLIYSSLKGNVGNYYGAGITLDLVRSNNYSLGIGYYEQEKKPANRPSDYSKGLFSIYTFGLGVARDNLQAVSLTGGKVFLSKSNSKIRYHLKGGLIYSFGKIPTNWVKLEDVLFSFENYTYEYEKYREIGILINPTIDIPVFKYLGFSAGPYALMNQKTISYGIELTSLIGIVKN